MNIWDSAQRSFEKASQAAARLARIQRLRSTIDNLSRLILMQNEKLLNKVMDLHVAGQLQQEELIPLCEELVLLQKQVEQAQAEIKQLQHQSQSSANPGQVGFVGTVPPIQTGEAAPYTAPIQQPPGIPYPASSAETIYAPPPPPPPGYQPLENALPVTAPPPPPPNSAVLPTSSVETLITNPVTSPPPLLQTQQCRTCQATLTPQQAFCSRCGTLTALNTAAHLPTQRSGQSGLPYSSDAETIRTDSHKELGGR